MRAFIFFISMLVASISFAQGDLNKVDANGLKQGTWEKKYENGQVRYTGQFKDDKPVGTFFYYYEDGSKSSEVTYVPESDVSHATFFHKNGAVMSKGDYYKQQKNGEWKFYDGKTVLSLVEHYKNGVVDGMQIVYFLNGKPSAQTPFVNGIKNGPFKEFFADGKVKIEGTFLDGNFEGEYKQYFSDGSIYMSGQYKAAVKDGEWRYHAEDGKIMAQELWDVGKLVKKVLAEGYEERIEPMELDEKDVLDENSVMEQYFNELNGGGN
jgi:antitoxin component YwqK of YwqJK toxin-antitoxin module